MQPGRERPDIIFMQETYCCGMEIAKQAGYHLDWMESTREAHYGKVVQWPVSKLMADRGYRDTFREANPDPQKILQGTWGFLSEDIISDRIDFIYCKREADSNTLFENSTGGSGGWLFKFRLPGDPDQIYTGLGLLLHRFCELQHHAGPP